MFHIPAHKNTVNPAAQVAHRPLAPGPSSDVLYAIEEALELLEDQEDVIDGDYGLPRPNRAMVVCQQLRQARAIMRRVKRMAA